MSALQDGWSTSAAKPRRTYYLRHQTITSTHTRTKHTVALPWLALNGLPRLDLLVTTMITPVGTGGIWLGNVHMCVCAVCVLHHASLFACFPACQCRLACLHVFISVSLYLCVCVCVYLLAWRAMLQGAWAASEGPVCPQSLTICALLVVIKVSNSEVSWGLAKRGQKMSLRCSSRWAAVTIFTYLYTLIVFALLPWHWGRVL